MSQLREQHQQQGSQLATDLQGLAAYFQHFNLCHALSMGLTANMPGSTTQLVSHTVLHAFSGLLSQHRVLPRLHWHHQ